MRSCGLLVAIVAIGICRTPLGAQAGLPAARFTSADTTRPMVKAPLAGLLSAAVPGAGQYALHLDRWVPPIALEALAWWQYRAHRREARNFERRYRALACQVARRVVQGECRDTSDFEYYELMGKSRYQSSGAYDSDPGMPDLQPETDLSTYNGHVWGLAMQLNRFDSLAALPYYRAHAIPEAYRWNWGESGLQQTVYDEYIRRSDDAFRTSSRILGFILVNHLASAIDAFIAARLRELAAQPAIQVRSGLEPTGGPVRWRTGVTLPAPGRPHL